VMERDVFVGVFGGTKHTQTTIHFSLTGHRVCPSARSDKADS